MLGALFLPLDAMFCASCVSLFLIDTYDKYSASALSTARLTRSCAAALFFSLFAPYMFDRLGFGLAATVLAAAFIVVDLATIVVLWF